MIASFLEKQTYIYTFLNKWVKKAQIYSYYTIKGINLVYNYFKLFLLVELKRVYIT